MGHRPVDLILKRLRRARRDERAELGLRVARIPRGNLREYPRERGFHDSRPLLPDDDQPLGPDAALAGIEQSPEHSLLSRPFDRRILAHDHRVAAPQFEHDLLQVAPRLFGNRSTSVCAAGEGDAPDPRIRDQLSDLVVRREDIVYTPLTSQCLSNRTAISTAHSGTSSEGFTITTLLAASCGAATRKIW